MHPMRRIARTYDLFISNRLVNVLCAMVFGFFLGSYVTRIFMFAFGWWGAGFALPVIIGGAILFGKLIGSMNAAARKRLNPNDQGSRWAFR